MDPLPFLVKDGARQGLPQESAWFENSRFLLNLAEKLRRERQLGEPPIYSPEVSVLTGLLEEMAVHNQRIYSLFDFEEYVYLFHTRNLFDVIGLDPGTENPKWNHAYISLLEDHKPVERFVAIKDKITERFSEAAMTGLQCVACGCYAVNLKGERIRGLYRSLPLSFDDQGHTKVCFDSLSNIRDLMLPEPGYWMRFSFANHVFCWHSHSGRLVEKDIITPREKELITLWKKGLSIPQISDAIHISAFTVKNQLSNARKKLLARDNTSLVQLCVAAGILAPAF